MSTSTEQPPETTANDLYLPDFGQGLLPNPWDDYVDQIVAALVAYDKQREGGLDDVAFVRELVRSYRLVLKFDGSMMIDGQLQQAERPADLPKIFRERRDVDIDWLIDEIMFYIRRSRIKRGLNDIKRAVRRVVDDEQRARKANVLLSLVDPLSERDMGWADAEWARLAQIFDEDPALSIDVLKHTIWQVKQKSAGRKVNHHLMPIIFSAGQGTGKTTFVRKFLTPLQELASNPVTLSDIVDTRSGGLFRYLVLFVDDVDRPSKGQVPMLKSMLTAERLLRRMLGKSWGKNWNQESSFIGTANERVSSLVADDSGHRRFAELKFRNGKVETGGDARIWPTINGIDYLLLWRSVDMFGPAPIQNQLRTLAMRQQAQIPDDIVATWARGLNFGREEVRQITKRPGIGARDLYDLFTDDTDASISEKAFAQQMKISAADPDFPFERKNRMGGGNFYRIKPSTS